MLLGTFQNKLWPTDHIGTSENEYKAKRPPKEPFHPELSLETEIKGLSSLVWVALNLSSDVQEAF